MARNISYATSTDYNRLHWLLVERKHVVCFVNYQDICMDVCLARCFPEDDRIMVSARGIEYGAYVFLREKQAFLADCERMKLEFIDVEPNR